MRFGVQGVMFVKNKLWTYSVTKHLFILHIFVFVIYFAARRFGLGRIQRLPLPVGEAERQLVASPGLLQGATRQVSRD